MDFPLIGTMPIGVRESKLMHARRAIHRPFKKKRQGHSNFLSHFEIALTVLYVVEPPMEWIVTETWALQRVLKRLQKL